MDLCVKTVRGAWGKILGGGMGNTKVPHNKDGTGENGHDVGKSTKEDWKKRRQIGLVL